VTVLGSNALQRLRASLALLAAVTTLLACQSPDSAPEPSCKNDVAPIYMCLTRSQMEETAQSTCAGNSNLSSANTPTPAPTIAAKFLANGCLAKQHTCDGCCQRALLDGEPQSDGSCCYYYCDDVCCGPRR
jgi:hypothetical protein